MKKLTSLIAFLLVSAFCFSQTREQDSLTIQLAFQKPDTAKVKTSLRLIQSLYDSQEYTKALQYISQSEKLSNDLNFEVGIAEITYFKALIYAEKGDYINAVNNYLKSKELYSKLQDTLSLAKVNNRIGLIEIERGNYEKGLEFSLSAIDIFEKRGLTKDLLCAYNNLANAYHSIHNYEKAIEFYEKTLELEKQLNKQGSINTLQRLAELYSQKRENRKAIDYYEKALVVAASNDSVRGEILPKLGGEYLLFKDYEKSADYLVEGLKLNRRTKNENGLLISLNALGDLNLQRSYLKYAEDQLMEALSIAEQVDNKSEQLKNYKLLKALDSTKKKYDRAFVWQRKYYDLKSEIEDENRPNFERSYTSNVLFTPDLTTKTKEPTPETDLVTEQQVLDSQKELNRLKLIFYALIGALLVVSTFLVLIYMKRNNRIKYMRELEEKNKKIELQKEALSEQAQHLEEINKVKDKLFSIVSHDLKDSLTSIKGFIDLLRDGSLTKEEFNNLIPELSENANNASLLLFNLLNWSKSQMQSLEAKPTLFDVQEVFEEKVQLLEQKLQNKSIKLRDKTLKDFIYADKSMVEIIIQNLMTNAIKFSRPGDTITVSNHISGGKAIISISDTGVGISKENIDKLFKNTSFTTTGTNNEKGTGLGLTICKELVELNHGQIWVESDLNVGTTFYVELPKSKPQHLD
ncbi:ATP-binding protein [Mangrovimonas sp. AS39]|uniref:tetratricopeptide repeat-containing sensor histidine kinase n=1 Tax=Mangrovimonas TaxID=1211036 RepID=UPI001421E10C|nr:MULTISPECIES: tetratricopeptide repeat protein [Mangrovimonas]MCF1191458.1 ATP-binding protein [Mangrovimonas futianensis]MCF1195153.1 ATP-binding protein [Mangrovimonas futianensis]NIK92305.1 sensor histidine kinase [Mangrovimonas sp. CR14]